jgi:hypothetical protein
VYNVRMSSRVFGALVTLSTAGACATATPQPCAPRPTTQTRPVATAGTKRAADVRWWLETDGPNHEIVSHEIGRDDGTVPLEANRTEAKCTYDRVSDEAGGEVRWLRCDGNGWRVQTIAACSRTYYVPGGPNDPNLNDVSLSLDKSVILAAGTDGKQFGVGLRCETIPKHAEP